MIVPIPDFTNLSFSALLATLFLFTAIDTGVAYIVAFTNNNFTAAYALDFVKTHVVKIATPVFLLALIGHGVAQLGIPPIPPAGVMAVGILTAYVAVTIKSIIDTFADKAVPPTTSSSVSPVTEPPTGIPPAQLAAVDQPPVVVDQPPVNPPAPPPVV